MALIVAVSRILYDLIPVAVGSQHRMLLHVLNCGSKNVLGAKIERIAIA